MSSKPLDGLKERLKEPRYRCADCNGLPWECTCGRAKYDLAQWIRMVGEELVFQLERGDWMSLTKERREEIRREVDRIKVTTQVRNTGWWCEVADTLLAELDRKDEEIEEESQLREQLAGLLKGVANGLRGMPGPLQSWGWSDLPERAERARAVIEVARKFCFVADGTDEKDVVEDRLCAALRRHDAEG